MLGAISGDTIGYAYEFNDTQDYCIKLFCGDYNSHDSDMIVAVAY